MENISDKEIQELVDKARSRLNIVYRDEDNIQLATSIDTSDITALMQFPYKIVYEKEKDLVYVELNPGEKIELTNKVEIQGIEATKSFISEFLPNVPFAVVIPDNEDIERERRAIYTCAVITSLFGETSIANNFTELLGNYNFSLGVSTRNNLRYNNFVEVLEAYRNLNSLIIKALIAACNYKISDIQKKSTTGFDAILSPEERIALSDFRMKRKNIIIQANEKLRNVSFAEWERMKIIDDRDLKLEALVNDSGRDGQLFKISLLNSEAIGPMFKDIINDIAYEQAMNFCDFKLGEDASGVEKTLFKEKQRKYRIRLSRLYVNDLKEKEYEILLNDPAHIVRTKR